MGVDKWGYSVDKVGLLGKTSQARSQPEFELAKNTAKYGLQPRLSAIKGCMFGMGQKAAPFCPQGPNHPHFFWGELALLQSALAASPPARSLGCAAFLRVAWRRPLIPSPYYDY